MFFSHDGEMALSFHAENGEHIGIVCSKCFKFFRPGSFGQHTEDCKDSLVPSRFMIKHWKDSAHLWADLKKNLEKDCGFDKKKMIWVARCDKKLAHVVHPSWCLSISCRIRAICITDGCTHVCALNSLQHHMKAAHMKGDYTLKELEFIKVGKPVPRGGN